MAKVDFPGGKKFGENTPIFPIRPLSDQVLENNKKRKKYKKTYVKKSAFFVKSKVNVEKIQHAKSFF